MTFNVTIVSDGTAKGTEVRVGDQVMGGVTSIEIDPIAADCELVTATINVSLVSLHLMLSKAQIECGDEKLAQMIEQKLLLPAENSG